MNDGFAVYYCCTSLPWSLKRGFPLIPPTENENEEGKKLNIRTQQELLNKWNHQIDIHWIYEEKGGITNLLNQNQNRSKWCNIVGRPMGKCRSSVNHRFVSLYRYSHPQYARNRIAKTFSRKIPSLVILNFRLDFQLKLQLCMCVCVTWTIVCALLYWTHITVKWRGNEKENKMVIKRNVLINFYGFRFERCGIYMLYRFIFFGRHCPLVQLLRCT